METTHKIRCFFDYGSGICLWAGDTLTSDTYTYPITPETLPLSAETRTQIQVMLEWYDTSLNWDYRPDPSPWRQDECERFNHAARVLFMRIQHELGDNFRVVYEQHDLTEDPALDEYLKNPKTFTRK